MLNIGCFFMFYWTVWAVRTSVADPCSCGKKFSSRIIGGSDVDELYNWMASLHYIRQRVAFCGASVVTSRHAITAAHCVYRRDHSMLSIGLGTTDMRETIEGYANEYPLALVIEHKNFDDETAVNDIALLITKKEILFGALEAPICLPDRTLGPGPATVTVIGWGWMEEGSGRMSRKLQEVDIEVIPLEECSEWLHGMVTPNPPTQICTYSPGKDSCHGDSGGPVIYLDPKSHRHILVGLVSFGEVCGGDTPSVNTDVWAFLGWINKMIRGKNAEGLYPPSV